MRFFSKSKKISIFFNQNLLKMFEIFFDFRKKSQKNRIFLKIFFDLKKNIFFGTEKKVGYSFDVKFYGLSIYEHSRAIPALQSIPSLRFFFHYWDIANDLMKSSDLGSVLIESLAHGATPRYPEHCQTPYELGDTPC